MVKRVLQLVEVHQTREQLLDKAHDHQQKIKQAFDKREMLSHEVVKGHMCLLFIPKFVPLSSSLSLSLLSPPSPRIFPSD
jgi:hypothetical protein